MSAYFRRSAVWRRQVAQWLEASESKLPEPNFIQGELPEWVHRLSREFMKTLFPEAKFKVGPEWSARELGGMIGHKVAYFHSLADLPSNPANGAFRKLDRKTRARAIKQIKQFAKCQAVAVQRSLGLASCQSYPDATEFFTAFAKALNKKPADADASNFHRTTTRVYWLMLVGWRSVERLRSVRDLQQALCRYLEPHVVGDVKRIEKICQRLGLHLGPRGRPQNSGKRFYG
jgi:hypothetical protein